VNDTNQNGTNAPENPETAEGQDVTVSDDAVKDNGESSPFEEMAALEDKLKSTHERLLRTAAELDNFRKRARRDVDEALARGRADVLMELLPVLDSIDLALGAKDADGANESIIEGVEMIKKQFLSATERFGLKAVESRDKGFDPNFHEAVAHVASPDHPAGQIVDEMRKGYLLGDKLLRAAMVVVSKGNAAPAAESDASSSDAASEPEKQSKIDETM
jgi:molecular chaperone GrpE